MRKFQIKHFEVAKSSIVLSLNCFIGSGSGLDLILNTGLYSCPYQVVASLVRGHLRASGRKDCSNEKLSSWQPFNRLFGFFLIFLFPTQLFFLSFLLLSPNTLGLYSNLAQIQLPASPSFNLFFTRV